MLIYKQTNSQQSYWDLSVLYGPRTNQFKIKRRRWVRPEHESFGVSAVLLAYCHFSLSLAPCVSLCFWTSSSSISSLTVEKSWRTVGSAHSHAPLASPWWKHQQKVSYRLVCLCVYQLILCMPFVLGLHWQIFLQGIKKKYDYSHAIDVTRLGDLIISHLNV